MSSLVKSNCRYACAIIAKEIGRAKILQLRVFRIGEIAYRGGEDGGVGGSAIKQILLKLVAPDVAQNPAIFVLLKKPGWSAGGA